MRRLPISIRTIRRPPTDAEVSQHCSIRLDALRTDPQSFLSTYTRESQFDRAKWRERLDQEGVWTFYAKYDEAGENALIVRQTCPQPWVATLTLFSPAFLAWFLASSSPHPITTNTVPSPTPTWPLSRLGPDTDLWLIIGVWVRPEWRRQGVAQKIVQAAIRSITSLGHSDGTLETSASDTYQPLFASSTPRKTIVLLEVYSRNRAAVELYRTVGFEILSNPNQPAPPPSPAVETINGSDVGGKCKTEEPETYWMGYTIPPLLPHRASL